MDASLAAIEAYLHSQIPVSRAMGIQLISNEPAGLTLRAPLALNHNHLGTAFGGSISAIATLAGYALLWMELGDTNAHLVIRRSSVVYHRPVANNLDAFCHRPDQADLHDFRKRFNSMGKARLTLTVEVKGDQFVCSTFQGEYVALR